MGKGNLESSRITELLDLGASVPPGDLMHFSLCWPIWIRFANNFRHHFRELACNSSGEKHRGWAVAEAKGLFLERVEYYADCFLFEQL